MERSFVQGENVFQLIAAFLSPIRRQISKGEYNRSKLVFVETPFLFIIMRIHIWKEPFLRIYISLSRSQGKSNCDQSELDDRNFPKLYLERLHDADKGEKVFKLSMGVLFDMSTNNYKFAFDLILSSEFLN